MIAWAKRDEWRGTLAEFLDRHSAQTCAAAGIEVEEIADVLGDDAATVAWGAAFEDLIATDLPGGHNIAGNYLKNSSTDASRPIWAVICRSEEYVICRSEE